MHRPPNGAHGQKREAIDGVHDNPGYNQSRNEINQRQHGTIPGTSAQGTMFLRRPNLVCRRGALASSPGQGVYHPARPASGATALPPWVRYAARCAARQGVHKARHDIGLGEYLDTRVRCAGAKVSYGHNRKTSGVPLTIGCHAVGDRRGPPALAHRVPVTRATRRSYSLWPGPAGRAGCDSGPADGPPPSPVDGEGREAMSQSPRP
jgi:hypothetical protein